jgi:hypothetical protein
MIQLVPIAVTAIARTAAGVWLKRSLQAYGAAQLLEWLWDHLADLIKDYLNSENGKAYLTSIVNKRIDSAGVDGLLFEDIFDAERLKRDVDKFAAFMINEKIGTTLTGVKSLTKNEVLDNIGLVVAQRINADAGTALSNVFPLANFREQIGMSVAAQLDTGITGAGGFLTASAAAAVRDAVAKNMNGYRPAKASKSTPSQLASNRARQAKYRKKHVAVWVPVEVYYGA